MTEVLKFDAVMDSFRIAPSEDLKKINTITGSTHAGNAGVLSFEPGPERKAP